MMFRPILITAFAAVVAASSFAMDVPRHTMISFEHILGYVEEIGNQDGQAQQVHSSMRFMQNEIHEQLAPMLNDDAMIDRAIAAEIVGETFRRNGFGELRTIVTAMILAQDRERAPRNRSQDPVDVRSHINNRTALFFLGNAIAVDARDLFNWQAEQPRQSIFIEQPIRGPFARAQEPRAQTKQEPSAPSHVHKAIGAEDECSICLEKIQGASDLVCVAPCDDHFHKACIEGWQKSDRSQATSCPNCRRAIEQLKPTPRN